MLNHQRRTIMVRVKILESNTVIEIDAEELTVRELLEKLGLSMSEHLVLRDNTVLTEEDVLKKNDEVVVYTVKSGG